MLGVSLDYHSDWAGWLAFEAIFAIIFVAEIVIKTVAAGHNWNQLGNFSGFPAGE